MPTKEKTLRNLRKSGGMVIRTATNALARIAYCADVRITIADVSCDLLVYALPEEYKPTYPLLLSRRWLRAVKAKGDYASGQYYIMHTHGTRVRIPRDRSATISAYFLSIEMISRRLPLAKPHHPAFLLLCRQEAS